MYLCNYKLFSLGAGYQKTTKEANYKRICMKACKKVGFHQ